MRFSRSALGALAIFVASAAPAGAATWLAPAEVQPPVHDVQYPVVVSAPGGTAYAAAQIDDGTHKRIVVSTRAPGQSFGPAVVVSGSDEDATDPAIAVDGSGTATVAFAHGATHPRIAVRNGSGSTWSPPTDVSAEGVTAEFPSVAVDPTGAAVVSWRQAATQTYAAVRSDTTAAFGAATQVSAATAGMNASHSAIADSGDALVAWSQPEPGGEIVMFASFHPAGGSFDVTPSPLSNSIAGVINSSVWQPRFRPDGSAVVMWDYNTNNDYTGANTVQWAERTAGASGGWGATHNAATAPPQAYAPAFGFDSTGTTFATWWTSLSGNGASLVSATRPAGGNFGATDPVVAARATRRDSSLLDNALAVAPSGFAVQLFQTTSGGNTAISSATRAPGGALDSFAPVSVGDASAAPRKDEWSPAVATDDQGNAAAAWVQQTGATYALETAMLDNAPPSISALNVPASATVGTAVPMSVVAADRAGPVTVHLDFGDGTAADGTSVSHTYSTPGVRSVSATVTDAAGNQVAQTHTISVAPAPDRVAPKISKLRITKKSFLAGRGTSFTFALSEGATLRIVISRSTVGRRVGKRCKPKTKANRKHKACTYTKRIKTVRSALTAGTHTLKFAGAGLPAGRYKATLVAVDAAGNASRPHTLSFSIKRH